MLGQFMESLDYIYKSLAQVPDLEVSIRLVEYRLSLVAEGGGLEYRKRLPVDLIGDIPDHEFIHAFIDEAEKAYRVVQAKKLPDLSSLESRARFMQYMHVLWEGRLPELADIFRTLAESTHRIDNRNLTHLHGIPSRDKP